MRMVGEVITFQKEGGGRTYKEGTLSLGKIHGFVEFPLDENVSVLFCVRPPPKKKGGGGGGFKKKKKLSRGWG